MVRRFFVRLERGDVVPVEVPDLIAPATLPRLTTPVPLTVNVAADPLAVPLRSDDVLLEKVVTPPMVNVPAVTLIVA